MICGSGGSKSRLAKASWPDERWTIARRCGISKSKCTKHTKSGPLLAVQTSKKCTPLWPEAHFEVKIYKTHQGRTSFGSYDVEKVHAVVARSAFRSQHAQNTPAPDHFWKLRCRKSARCCGAKHISKWKCTKHTMVGWDVEKVHAVGRKAHFEVKMCKTHHVWTTFGGLDVLSRGRCKGLWTLSKVSKTWRFCGISKNDSRRGTFERICKDAFSVAGAIQKTCSSELLRGPGGDFLRGVAFWSLRSSGLLRWFCVTGAARRMTWHHFFVGRRSSLDKWNGKIAKRIGTRLSVLHASNFPFLKEGSLAELLRFWCCQVWKLKKSRRIASFLTLSSSNSEEVSQNCCAFDAVKFNTWGRLAE